MYDVVIIGAGVSGSASARELSRYKVNACVIEKQKMCVQEHQKQIVGLFMLDSMLQKVH